MLYIILVCHTITMSNAKIQNRYEGTYQLQYNDTTTKRQIYKSYSQYEMHYMYFCQSEDRYTFSWQLNTDTKCSTNGDIEAPYVSSINM